MRTGRHIKTSDRNVLNCEQKIKVTLWIQNHKEECGKHDSIQLARIASKDLGFSVSYSTIRTNRDIIHPGILPPHLKAGDRKVNGGVLMQKIRNMQDEINDLDHKIEVLNRALLDFRPDPRPSLSPNS